MSVSAPGCSKGQTFEVSNTSHCLLSQLRQINALLLKGWYATAAATRKKLNVFCKFKTLSMQNILKCSLSHYFFVLVLGFLEDSEVKANKWINKKHRGKARTSVSHMILVDKAKCYVVKIWGCLKTTMDEWRWALAVSGLSSVSLSRRLHQLICFFPPECLFAWKTANLINLWNNPLMFKHVKHNQKHRNETHRHWS